jgi:3-hydroxybutyryl-CoA dehydrogenase
MDEDKKAGVIGAGLMGAEITLVFALGGNEVVPNDHDKAALDRGAARIAAVLRKGVDRRSCTPIWRRRCWPASTPSPISPISLIARLSPVFEAIEVKTAVLQALDATCAADCVIATNTSALPISTLAGALPPARRHKCIGTHYFSPVLRMPLLEVIPGFDTDIDVIGEIADLMRASAKRRSSSRTSPVSR